MSKEAEKFNRGFQQLNNGLDQEENKISKLKDNRLHAIRGAKNKKRMKMSERQLKDLTKAIKQTKVLRDPIRGKKGKGENTYSHK